MWTLNRTKSIIVAADNIVTFSLLVIKYNEIDWVNLKRRVDLTILCTILKEIKHKCSVFILIWSSLKVHILSQWGWNNTLWCTETTSTLRRCSSFTLINGKLIWGSLSSSVFIYNMHVGVCAPAGDVFSGMDWMTEKLDLSDFDLDSLIGSCDSDEPPSSPEELLACLDTWSGPGFIPVRLLRWPSTFRSLWRSSPSRWIPTTRLNWAARCVWSNPPKSCWLHPTSCWLLVAATRRTATAGSPNPRRSLQAPPEPNPTPDPTRMLLKRRRAATRQTATAGSPNPRRGLQAPPEPNPTPDPTQMLLKWCIRNRRRWSRTRRQRRGTGRRNAPSRRRWTPSAPSWRRQTGSSRRKPRLSAERYGTWEIWWRRSGPPSTAGSEPSTPSGPVRLRHSFVHSSTGLVNVLDRSRVVC